MTNHYAKLIKNLMYAKRKKYFLFFLTCIFIILQKHPAAGRI